MPRTRRPLTSAKSEASESRDPWFTHRCGRKWRGPSRAHCGKCHETFGSVTSFDEHRIKGVKGECANPATIGMVQRECGEKDPYEIWVTPMDEQAQERMERMRDARHQPALF